MGSRVLDGATAVALDRLHAALDALAVVGVGPVDARDAVTVVREVEAIGRRVRAVQVELVEEIDRRGLHRVDGHASAKVLVRHAAQLSDAEAARRARAARALGDLPAVHEAFAAGTVGVCQVERIARAHANPRVRDRFCGQDAAVARAARVGSYRAFDAAVTDWVRHVDADGTCDTAERHHQDRDARLVQDYDGSWNLTATCGSLQGAELHSILGRFVDAEVATDWAKARIDHGDAATVAHLARSDAQRRFDALIEIAQRGATSAADATGGSQVVTDIVIDHTTFERHLARLAGTDPSPIDATFGSPPDPGRVGLRCSTLDGHPVDPTEAVAAALIGHVRRVVVGADSVVIDLGRKRRLFTGPAQLAARLASTECYWPGCHVPVTACQTDHLIAWADRGGGRTNPGNGGPACGKHNRHKQAGYTVHRDPAGTWHTHRPDGTEIT